MCFARTTGSIEFCSIVCPIDFAFVDDYIHLFEKNIWKIIGHAVKELSKTQFDQLTSDLPIEMGLWI